MSERGERDQGRADALAERDAAEVTVLLVDGTSQNGKMERFSPFFPDLLIVSAQGERAIVHAERVACVGFRPVKGETRQRPSANDVAFKLQLRGKTNHRVWAARAAVGHPLGFYALPREESTAEIGEFFFYAHAIDVHEEDVLLGTILQAQGVIKPEGVDAALQAQKKQRLPRVGEILVKQAKVTPEDVERAAVEQLRRKMRIGELLIDSGLVTQADVDAALVEQKNHKGRRLGQVLVDMGLVTESAVRDALAQKFRLDIVDLDECALSPAALDEVPREYLRRYEFLPIDTNPSVFTVAISDPLNTRLYDALRVSIHKRIREVLVLPSQLERFLRQHGDEAGASSQVELILQGAEVSDATPVTAEAYELPDSDNVTVKLANQIISDAVERGASDIHIEPNGREHNTLIRFRIDGKCGDYQQLPPAYRGPLVARMKVMARLDLSERRKPQDGKIRFKMNDRMIELRVATVPTVNGNEDVVMRVLAASKPKPPEKMGFSEHNLARLRDAIGRPHGLFLCVGPTGSGKTTTLHSALGAINDSQRKIWTAEDPVEITQPGLRQVQVQSKIGFTFAAAMRAFLRADPDVIMIGEMRDHETASTAVEASLTGHMVFSTLHTNSAPETITRLLDMGLDPFSFADSLVGVLAQRLTRQLCSSCSVVDAATPTECAQLTEALAGLPPALAVSIGSDTKLRRAKGCPECGDAGYRGRIALHELLLANDPIREAIQHKAPVSELRRLAVADGMTTLLQDGLIKVLQGKTDMQQVLAVCTK